MRTGDIKKLFARVYILLKSILKITIKKQREHESGVSTNLIIFTGLLGDAVFVIEPLRRLRQHYKIRDEDVVIATRSAPAEFMRLIDGLSGVKFYEVDFKRYCEDIGYFNNFNRQYLKTAYNDIIIFQQSRTASVMNFNSNGRRRIQVWDDVPRGAWRLINRINRRHLTDVVVTGGFDCLINRYSRTSDIVTEENSKVINPKIEWNTFVCDTELSGKCFLQNPFVVISPFSSSDIRNLADVKLRSVMGFILNCGYNIAVSVLSDRINDAKHIINGLPPDKVKIFGNTSLTEWISLIRSAEFLIGMDSASIHIASAVGTQAFCCLSGKDDENIYPYRGESVEGTCQPILIKTKRKECFGCFIKGNVEGYGNVECRKMIKSTGTVLCMSELTAEEIIFKIKEYLRCEKG